MVTSPTEETKKSYKLTLENERQEWTIQRH